MSFNGVGFITSLVENSNENVTYKKQKEADCSNSAEEAVGIISVDVRSDILVPSSERMFEDSGVGHTATLKA